MQNKKKWLQFAKCNLLKIQSMCTVATDGSVDRMHSNKKEEYITSIINKHVFLEYKEIVTGDSDSTFSVFWVNLSLGFQWICYNKCQFKTKELVDDRR